MIYRASHEMYSQYFQGVGIHGVLMDAKFMGNKNPFNRENLMAVKMFSLLS